VWCRGGGGGVCLGKELVGVAWYGQGHVVLQEEVVWVALKRRHVVPVARAEVIDADHKVAL
jgi:hypothetical protein